MNPQEIELRYCLDLANRLHSTIRWLLRKPRNGSENMGDLLTTVGVLEDERDVLIQRAADVHPALVERVRREWGVVPGFPTRAFGERCMEKCGKCTAFLPDHLADCDVYHLRGHRLEPE